MPQASFAQTNFTAGELSPKLRGRVDIRKYANGAETVSNFYVMPYGGIRKRGGTNYIWNQKDQANAARLVPFSFSTTQSYMLEFSNAIIRVLKDQGIVTESDVTITGITQANPGVVTTSAPHGYSNGDSVIITGVVGMTEVNNQEFVVANQTATTFELFGVDTSAYTAYSSAGTVNKIVEITSPYSTAEVQEIEFTQSADTLYIFHESYKPRLLTRTSDTAWTISEAGIEGGPFQDINTDDTLTVYLSGGTPTAYGTYAEGDTGLTMTASDDLFTSSHVGALWRLYVNNEGNGWSALIASETSLAVNRVYTSDGKIYALTADNYSSSQFKANMGEPSHSRGTVRHYEDGQTTSYGDWLYLHDASCIVEVTGFTSSTVVTVKLVKNHAPEEIIGSGNATSFWQEGSWSDEAGWPQRGTLAEERLWTATTATELDTIWASKIGAYLDFADGDEDDDALNLTVSSEQVNKIQWIVGGSTLTFGTTGGEYAVSASTRNEAITPTNVSIKRQTAYGSSDMAPFQIGNAVMFGQRDGEPTNNALIIREYAYLFDVDGYVAANMTILSDHITGTGITQLAYQQSPYQILWAVQADGKLVGLTYERDQEVLAWHVHTIGGTDVVVEDIAVIPGVDGDELWLTVSRTINSATVRYIELLSQGHEDDGVLSAATFFDSYLTYSGSPATTITGLEHLEGESISALADGLVVGPYTVTNGSITLDDAASTVATGLSYTSLLKTMRPEGGAASGTAQGKRKRISETVFRLYQSIGGEISHNGTDYDPLMPDDTSLVTGDRRLDFPGGWGEDANIHLRHADPRPFSLSSIFSELRVTG